jgi:hypothetical protein
VPWQVRSRGRLLAVGQVAGVAATGVLVWSDVVLPRLRWETIADLTSRALLYVALAWIGAAAIAFAIYFVLSLADFPEVIRFSARSAAPAMWFAPAIILASVRVPGAFFVSAVLVASATCQLVSRWAPSAAAGSVALRPATAMFGSCAAQLGLVAELWNKPLLASALFAASAAVIMSLALALGAYQPAKQPVLPNSLLSILAAFLLAVSLSYGGLRARLTGGGGGSGGAYAAGQPAAQNAAKTTDPPSGNLAPDGDFPGVILLPEVKPKTVLLMPPPLPPSLLNVPLTKPVGIPFSGEYWMFRWPAHRPPARSFVRHGTPAEISFHTTDGWPIQMEAHQRVEPPADTSCCGKVQLVITDAEAGEGAASLELLLIDSQTGLLQSLGSEMVSAGRVTQTLTYTMPWHGSLHRFDEFKIVFHRNDARTDKSSKIAIERFILAP